MDSTKETIDRTAAKLEAQLHLWAAKLNEVAAKATVAGQQLKVDSRKQLDELKARIDVAQVKLDQAKVAGSEKWEVLKKDVEHTWHELESAFKKLID